MPPHQTNPLETDPFTMTEGQVVIVIDPYSTGCLVGKEIAMRGYELIALWTKGFSEDMKTHVPQSCGKMSYLAEVTQVGSLSDTADAVKAAADDYFLADVRSRRQERKGGDPKETRRTPRPSL